jgi:acetyltransferase-like isoleucine patch superfamily enzyme
MKRQRVPSVLRRCYQMARRVYAVRGAVSLGRRVHLGVGTIVNSHHGLDIGDDVYIGKYCTVSCDGSIGSGVLIANNVGMIGRHDHDFRMVGRTIRHSRWVGDAEYPQADGTEERLVIEDDVWVGFGGIILSGVRVGTGAIVAAGAVVVHDVPAYSIVAGNPAAPIGTRFTPEEIAVHESILRGGGL